MRKIALSLFCGIISFAHAQEGSLKVPPLKDSVNYFIYDTDLLSKDFHKGRRDALRKIMPDSSVAVFFTNPVRNRSNDVDYEYHQDPNFYYLTGLTEPNAVLLIFKNKLEMDGKSTNEIIFVQERDPGKEIWNGRRLGKEGVKDILGFDAVGINKQFAEFGLDTVQIKTILYTELFNDVRDDNTDRGDLYSLIKHFKLKTTNSNIKIEPEKLKEIMSGLRQIKLDDELILMRKAIDITCEAQKELMKTLNPGMTEYQSEAIIEFIFQKNGAEYPGYPSIIGGGENSCILHYTTNRKPLESKNLLVVDVGAEYHGYTADVTRTIPVDGNYSEEEKIIYNIVLEAQMAGINAAKAGNTFWAPHDAAKAVIEMRLKELGIIKDGTELRKYFMHGTSHYLGLDVHDAGLYGRLNKGNVITIEPGIYISAGSPCDPKWWNIGVRIEDDILITENGNENLSDCIPKTIEEIEALMKENSPLNNSLK